MFEPNRTGPTTPLAISNTPSGIKFYFDRLDEGVEAFFKAVHAAGGKVVTTFEDGYYWCRPATMSKDKPAYALSPHVANLNMATVQLNKKQSAILGRQYQRLFGKSQTIGFVSPTHIAFKATPTVEETYTPRKSRQKPEPLFAAPAPAPLPTPPIEIEATMEGELNRLRRLGYNTDDALAMIKPRYMKGELR